MYRKATDFCPYPLRPVFLKCPDSFSLWGKQSVSVFALNIPWKHVHRWLSWDVTVMPAGTLCCVLFHFLKHDWWTCWSNSGTEYGQETRRRWTASQGTAPESLSCSCFSFGEKSACVFCPFSVWMFFVFMTCGVQFVSSSCKSGLHWAAFSFVEMQRTSVSLFEWMALLVSCLRMLPTWGLEGFSYCFS